MNDNKPKLELQVNIPKKIKLLQDTPASGESQYGKWWLYNVLSNDQEQSFFAPEPVVKFISENQLKRNSEIEITKKLVKNGKKNVTDFEISIVHNGAVQKNGNSDPTNGAESPSSKPEGAQIQNGNEYQKMLQAMKEAILIRGELGADVDINKIGITLFIQKSKGNHQNY